MNTVTCDDCGKEIDADKDDRRQEHGGRMVCRLCQEKYKHF